jgi:serine/threonine-protein kinase
MLGERYELRSRIAAGGMGEVWRAYDSRLLRDVAVKVLLAQLADDPLSRQRIAAEARAAGAVHCEAVVDVYDYGEQTTTSGTLPYLVMELVTGSTVAAELGRDGLRPPTTTETVLADAASGLAAAHRLGLVHRDIKPANLLLTTDHRVKIADFGIARAVDAAGLTLTGTLVGTATYLSPEQVEGQPATAASDIYGLGVVAFVCLTGQPPFRGDGEIATALARLHNDVPPLPATVHPGLRALVLDMLHREPGQRPSADEVSRRVRVLGQGTGAGSRVGPVGAQPTAVLPLAASPHRRTGIRNRAVALGGVLALGAALTVLGFQLSDGNAQPGGSAPAAGSTERPTPTPSATAASRVSAAAGRAGQHHSSASRGGTPAARASVATLAAKSAVALSGPAGGPKHPAKPGHSKPAKPAKAPKPKGPKPGHKH